MIHKIQILHFKRLGLSLFLVYALAALFLGCDSEAKPAKEAEILPPVKKNGYQESYGFDIEKYRVIADTVREGNTLALIFGACEVPYEKSEEVVRASKKMIDLKNIKPGSPYKFLYTKDSIPKLEAFIYEPNLKDYYVVHFKDPVAVEQCARDVKTVEKSYKGSIDSSLWKTIEDNKLDPDLAIKLSEIFAWSVDFFRLSKGDRFKVILKEDFIKDSVYIGIGEIKGAVFEHNGETFYAMKYEDPKGGVGYYDEKGANVRRPFLKSPLKFFHITSHFSNKRFHPILKKWKGHFGTDYGAPVGTPIMATADGVVEASAFTKNNGNYVKIRHNNIYQTQYLHMSRRAVRAGQRVRQGQVIGYVGQTGLATGPHVCYRFWKSGVQVNSLTQKMPKSLSIAANLKADFTLKTAPIKDQLKKITF